MDYGLTPLSPPAIEPLTLREIKRHLNMADQFIRDDVYLVEQLLPQCRREVEDYCGRSLITQTWQLTIDRPPGAILLPRSPVQAVTTAEVEDSNGAMVAVDPDDLRLLTDREPAVLHVAYPKTWPTDRGWNLGGVRIEYVTGYGAAAADVPAGLKGCVLRLIEAYYRVRGAGELPDTLCWAMDNWRVGDEFDQYAHGLTAGVQP